MVDMPEAPFHSPHCPVREVLPLYCDVVGSAPAATLLTGSVVIFLTFTSVCALKLIGLMSVSVALPAGPGARVTISCVSVFFWTWAAPIAVSLRAAFFHIAVM